MRKIVLATIVCLLVGFIQAQNYNIKNRWNIKAGYSRYANGGYSIGSNNDFIQKRSSNFRIEGNYGVLSCLELGLYAGIISYPVYRSSNPGAIYNDSIGLPVKKEIAVAPTFGLNVNFHILPLFVKKEDCRWDLYVCAKYGGCYLIEDRMPSEAIDYSKVHYPEIKNPSDAKTYKHEYGVGIGGSVYFWKVFGLYAECSVGQYTVFENPSFQKNAIDYFNIRGGFTFKWSSNKGQ
ncbi:MAG: hypothetical protein LBL13_05770 [Bacteroidales bacterium]|jgi:hypothetical protein|nr:hypothetical protein [Bacteroidales bacterium]